MSRRFYPQPPHVDLAFYFDGRDGRHNLEQVRLAVARSGGVRPHGFDAVVGSAEPIFSSIATLATREFGHNEDAANSLIWPVRVDYESVELGELIVQYGATEDSRVIGSHPVCARVSGADFEFLEDSDDTEASRIFGMADRMLGIFKDVCDGGNVLYASILFERNLPAPDELLNGAAQLGPELFIGRTLSALGRHELDSALSELSCERWEGGSYWSAWAPFNRERRTVVIPSSVRTKIALIVGELLRRRLTTGGSSP